MTGEMTVTIRPGRDGDMDAVTAIHAHHVAHGTASFETVVPTLEDMRTCRAALLDQGFPYLVAEEKGIVIGYAYAGYYRLRAAYRDTVENSVYLHPDRTGRGTGKRLLMALIAGCEALGFRQMVAVVGDSANLASVGMHKSRGFRLVGTLTDVGFKHGRWLDTVLLQRALGSGRDAPPARGA